MIPRNSVNISRQCTELLMVTSSRKVYIISFDFMVAPFRKHKPCVEMVYEIAIAFIICSLEQYATHDYLKEIAHKLSCSLCNFRMIQSKIKFDIPLKVWTWLVSVVSIFYIIKSIQTFLQGSC